MRDGSPSSAGWATFEARVREKRFARCIERAAASLDTGSIDEAREALDEARELCPDRPEIAQFESLIVAYPGASETLLEPMTSPHAYDLQQQEVPAGWTRVLAAVAVLVILFGLFGFGLTQLYLTRPEQALLFTDVSRPSEEPVGTASVPAHSAPATPAARESLPAPAPSIAEVPPAVAPTPTTPPPSLPSQPFSPRSVPQPSTPTVPQSTIADRSRDASTTGQRPAITRPSPDAQAGASKKEPLTQPPARSEPARSEPAPAAAAPTPAVEVTTARREPPPPVPTSAPTPDRRAIVEPAVSNLPAEIETAARGAVPPPVPALEAPAARSVPMAASRADESLQIRSVLARYETAYNKLDASGASSVYPSVDQAALDRAFRGLISQRVSLGLCDITVVGDVGGASCAGKARWEPKVGGGLQTADRHWTFNLRKSGESWRIEQVRVR